jgi:methionyl-tRNA formyltransferase
MRIVFMGSAALSCHSLDSLLASAEDEVVGIVTQPDKPKGRGRQMTACPVKEHIAGRNIPILVPTDVNTGDSIDAISRLKPDAIVVVAYGQILRKDLLSLPAKGCINVHTSLLPKYRGAAPIQWAIANGEQVTGVTTMFMDVGMDTGDIILQQEVPIDHDDTGGSLHDKLAIAGADLLGRTIAEVRAETVERRVQDDAKASFAPKLKKTDGKISWTSGAADIYNRVRAFNPWPCCFCSTDLGQAGKLRVLRARVEDCTAGVPGEVIEWAGDGPLVRAGDCAVRLLEVQPSGKKAMEGPAYVNGYGSPVRFQ